MGSKVTSTARALCIRRRIAAGGGAGVHAWSMTAHWRGGRGSLNIDDEGTPTQCTTLIENGVLRGYMQDRLNAG